MPSTLKRQPSRSSSTHDDSLRLHNRTHVRRPLVAVASLLLVVVSVALFTSLYAHAGGRVSVLAVAHDVALGQVIDANDVMTARISVSSGLSTIPADDTEDVIGHRAGVDLQKGTLLAFDELGGKSLPTGRAVVGVATKAGGLPAEGVLPGELVEVVLTDPATGQAEEAQGPVDQGGSATAAPASASDGTATAFGSVVIPDATVTAVADDSSGDGTVVVSVLVPLDVAPVVAIASAAGQAAIVAVGRGS